MSIKNNDYTSCSDIEIASILVANNHKLLKTEKVNTFKTIFFFEKNSDVEKK